MSEFDSKALELAREVMALIKQEHIGGDVQLLAKIQLLFIGAMEYDAPRTNSPAVPDGFITAVNRLLDSDGSRGCYSAIQCYEAHEEIEKLLAAAPKQESE